MKYKYLFFDLDRTLWDYKANSEQTLIDLVKTFTPQLSSQTRLFIEIFYKVNEALWLQYRDGIISKEYLSSSRFIQVYKHFGIDAVSMAEEIAQYYIVQSPQKNKLFPDTRKVLSYLKSMNYSLYLLTNGFLEVQKVKIRTSDIERYFEGMITSEEVGYQKPDSRIFEYALRNTGGQKNNSIMIGDDLDNDIFGAQNFGIDTIYFNPQRTTHKGNPTYEINNLIELIGLF
ncbi:MAG: YjjG family noncanonical pyrimidine nucleotidase [Salinivirgaceae bacterium]